MKAFALSLVSALALGFFFVPADGGGTKVETIGTIHRKDPKFDELLPKDAQLVKLAGGFKWTEGVCWVPAGFVIFSDIPNNVVHQWSEKGGIRKFMHPAGYTGKSPRDGKGSGDEPGSNGLRVGPDGKLVLCRHGDRQVARLEVPLTADMEPLIGDDKIKLTVLADKYQGKRLNSPNDLVFATNGDLYFTDPPYGLLKQTEDPARELDFQGVYRIKKGSTELELLTKELSRPNGIALSPDNKTLYVANSDPAHAIWAAFPLNADGSLGKHKVLFDATLWVKQKKPGLPDGMKVDVHGNLWATGPGGIHVFTPDGTLLGTIETGVPTGNICFGDDGSTLYVACNHDLARIRTSTKGLGFK